MYQQLVPVSSERHAKAYYERQENLLFAREEMAVELVADELPKAVASLPLALMDVEGEPRLVAILSLLPGKNSFVTPGGRWVGGYVPALYRIYPFALRYRQQEDGSQGSAVLCMDEKVLTDDPEKGVALFTEEGEASDNLNQVRQFLTKFEQQRLAMHRACEQLVKAGVVVPWNFKVKLGEEEQAVNGIYRVDEAALNALDAETFAELRQGGALAVAYTQLLSQHRLPILQQQSARQYQADQRAEALREEIGDFSAEGDDSASFNF